MVSATTIASNNDGIHTATIDQDRGHTTTNNGAGGGGMSSMSERSSSLLLTGSSRRKKQSKFQFVFIVVGMFIGMACIMQFLLVHSGDGSSIITAIDNDSTTTTGIPPPPVLLSRDMAHREWKIQPPKQQQPQQQQQQQHATSQSTQPHQRRQQQQQQQPSKPLNNNKNDKIQQHAEKEKEEHMNENSNDKNSTTTSLYMNNNPLYQLFQSAGVNESELTPDIVQQLPQVLESMEQMYGNISSPVILGMQYCKAYQLAVPRYRRYTAVAGLFNTGTNAMQYHLQHNIPNVNFTWQVPWGKHRLSNITRLIHIAPGLSKYNQRDVLPIVMIRDPFSWMQSMCKSAYATDWLHTKEHCPNLVPTPYDVKKFGPDIFAASQNQFNITVSFDKNQILTWNSLIHFYNDWNKQYVFDAKYPRLIVRFEDMLLHAPEILRQIAKCVGVPPFTTFKYQVDSAKSHGSHTNFVKAVLKSGNQTVRLNHMTVDDLAYAKQHLDRDLMRVLHYTIPTTVSVATKR